MQGRRHRLTVESLELPRFCDVTWSGEATVWDTNESWEGTYFAPAELISVTGTSDTSLGLTSLQFSGSATLNVDEGGGVDSYSLRGGAGYSVDAFGGAFSFRFDGFGTIVPTVQLTWPAEGEFNVGFHININLYPN